MAVASIEQLQDRIDKTVAGATSISMSLGGVQFKSYIELMEFAKLMAVSGAAVPIHLRGNPGACLAICTKALRFGFDPFSLAEHSYAMVKNQKNEDGAWEKTETIAYDSFVLAAIVNAHAPLTGRIDFRYAGEGDDRRCTAFSTPKGANKPLEHTSPTLGELKTARGKNDKGQIRGSQLWIGPKSDQQLTYDTRRDFCRKFFPEILMGWYDKDEFDENARVAAAQDVTPKPDIASRLDGAKGKRGFSRAGVEQALVEHKPGETLNVAPAGEKQPVEIKTDAKGEPVIPASLDRRAHSEADADEIAEWLDEQIAIANNLKTAIQLDELDPKVWKHLRDANRAKDLGEKWESEGFNPNMNRLDPARKAKK